MKKIKLVRQQHANSCAIASIAMVSDKKYEDVLSDFWTDFNEEGLELSKTISYLGDHGYQLIHKYITHYGHKDFSKHLMLEPFAPRHIIRLQFKFDMDMGHVAAMDSDGTIYDPQGLSDEEIRQAYIITDIVGVFPADYKGPAKILPKNPVSKKKPRKKPNDIPSN